MIDLNTTTFWLFCTLAVLVLVPVRPGVVLRKWLFACINIGFLTALLGSAVSEVLVGIVIVYLLVRATALSRYRVLVIGMAAAVFVALFFAHKLPDVARGAGYDRLSRVLAAVGYSYVLLRMVELFRAVYERRHPPPDLPSTVNYLLPFHMLAAGPIQAYDDFVRQPGVAPASTPGDTLAGVERIAEGLFKKFVLAHILQKLFLTNFQAGGAYMLVEMQAFLVWLFLDFSAYSDIAVGIGKVIGVSTPENFNRPLLSRNVIDFWERWHISLSMFLRRNVFIPLQVFLMRKNDSRTPLASAAIAIIIAFALAGLWHGLTPGFVAWALLQAVGLIIVRVYDVMLVERLGKPRVKQYLANPWIRVAAIVLAFEFEAATLLPLFLV